MIEGITETPIDISKVNKVENNNKDGIHIRKKYELPYKINILPGDIIHGEVQDKDGTQYFCNEFVGRDLAVDSMVTLDVKNVMGIKDGIGLIFADTLQK